MDGRRRTLLLSAGLTGCMLGVVAASVPLYRLFCQVTGYAGTPKVVSGAPAEAGDGTMTVRFDTNVMPDMPWKFRAATNSMTVRLGEPSLAVFTAENLSGQPIVGTAVFNVTPEKAGGFVDKIQCFCFTQQRLEPGQKAELPVTFYVDPNIRQDHSTADLKTLTLSYTFYKSRDQSVGAQESAAPVQATAEGKKRKT